MKIERKKEFITLLENNEDVKIALALEFPTELDVAFLRMSKNIKKNGGIKTFYLKENESFYDQNLTKCKNINELKETLKKPFEELFDHLRNRYSSNEKFLISITNMFSNADISLKRAELCVYQEEIIVSNVREDVYKSKLSNFVERHFKDDFMKYHKIFNQIIAAKQTGMLDDEHIKSILFLRFRSDEDHYIINTILNLVNLKKDD